VEICDAAGGEVSPGLRLERRNWLDALLSRRPVLPFGS
jgi:hypothetical protein